MDLDFDALARDLIRALRGRRSQVQLSRWLGYRANVVYTWESGRKQPTATTFLRAAGRVGIDVGGGMARFFRIAPDWVAGADWTSPATVGRLLDELRGTTPTTVIAERVGASRYAVARWLHGKAEPRLPDLLRAVEATSQRVLDWIAIFADPGAMPSAREAWTRLDAARSLFVREPWAQAVLLVLELPVYRASPAHDDALVARLLGLPADDVARCMRALIDSGQVRPDGARYTLGRVQAVDTRRHPDAGRLLKAFWAREALRRFENGTDGLFSFNVFTISEADYARLQELHLQHWQAVRTLVAGSVPGERLVLMNLQTLPLDRP